MNKLNEIKIATREYWVKIVEFLQQNWALIDNKDNKGKIVIYFISDASGVFDTMDFTSRDLAEQALLKNGFKKYLDPSENFTDFIYPPQPPFEWRDHPNGKIYSSGKYWVN